MSEQIQTRTEHSRSLEDAEKYRAIHTLTELGLLVPLSKLETYHGRQWNQGQEDFRVDPAFRNGGNDSGNSNINTRPTLYTSDQRTAQDFADARVGFDYGYNKHLFELIDTYTPEERQEQLNRQNQYMRSLWEEEGQPAGGPTTWTMEDLEKNRSFLEVEHLREKLGTDYYKNFKMSYAEKVRADVHKIASADSDATVLDLEFDASQLNEEDAVRYKQALAVITRQTPVTEGSPVSFDNRHAVKPVVEAIKNRKKTMLLNREISDIAEETGVEYQVALQLVSAYNAANITRVKPSYLVSSLIKHPQDIFIDNMEVDGKKEELPVNLEYVQRYLRNAHIVGVRQKVSSATLNRSITSVSLFDLEKVTTETNLVSEREDAWQRLGSLAVVLGGAIESNAVSAEKPLLMNLLTDAHVKPHKLIEAARQLEGYDDLFNADAGNWEGFTLAEHTETVLRNFDENFADKLPVQLIAPMRLAILAHDLGKPRAVSEGSKHREKEFNNLQARDFLSKLNVNEDLVNLTLAIIGEGAQLAHQINTSRDRTTAEIAMKELALKTLRLFHSAQDIPESEVKAFSEMCKMLQVCDGGAYTSMAITRSESMGGRYRNAPSFNQSFSQPLGFGQRTIKLRDAGEDSATLDLAPQNSHKPVSRVRVSSRGAGGKPPKLVSHH